MRYLFGHFVFDTDNLRLDGPDGERALRPMSAKVLHVLLESAPGLLRHDELLDRVWGRQAVTPGVVTHSIREIRAALGDAPQQPVFIETRHRLGYCFIAPVRIEEARSDSPDAGAPLPAQASTAAPGDAMPDQAAPPLAVAPMRRIWLPVVSALVVLALIAVVWMLAGERGHERGWHEAIEIVHDGRPREPQALDWYRQGLEALREGRLREAEEWLERSRAREPEATATLAALADSFAQAGAIARAQQWIVAAEHAAAALPRAEQLRIAAYKARLEYRWDDAIAHLTAVHQLDPGDTDVAFRLFDAQLASARLGDATATLQALAAQPAPTLDAWRLAMAQARLATARGDHSTRKEAAIAALEQARTPSHRLQSRLEQAWAWLLLGHSDEVETMLSQMPKLADGTTPDIDTLRVEQLRATWLREAGNYPGAQARFEQIATLAQALGQAELAARAQREAAYVQIQAGQPGQAVATLQPVIEALAAQGDIRELASAKDVLSLALQRSGDMPAAQSASEAALAAYTQTGDRLGEAATRNHLGMMYGRSTRNDEAREQFETALRLFGDAGDRRGQATAQSNLAILDGRAGRREAARERNEAALAAFRELASWPDVARLQFNLAVQDRGLGRLVDAETRFAEALAAFERIGAADHARQARASLAELALAQADPGKAARWLGDDPASHEGSPQARAALVTARGRMAALRGDVESADSAYRNALTLRQDAGLTDWARMSALDLAELSARRGELAQAEQVARQLRRDMAQANDARAAIQAGLLLTAVLERQRQPAAAAQLLDTLDAELVAHPDAMLALRLDLLRVVLRDEGRTELAAQVAASARAIGYELLALRADLIAGGQAGQQAKAALDRQGIVTEGLPPALPY